MAAMAMLMGAIMIVIPIARTTDIMIVTAAMAFQTLVLAVAGMTVIGIQAMAIMCSTMAAGNII
jgi:hypothetical protein